MAISDVKEYTHLSEEEVEALGREFDQIRADIEASRGAADAAYINRMITIQRTLAAAGRVTLFASKYPPAWVAGATMLGIAKILENMEIGHNVMHGQWDWMNDPEIHSSNWEWDTAQPAEQWKHSHNYVHHQFTNVLGYDNDIGYGVLRMAREQKWHPVNLGQPVYNTLLALLFQWGVALHDLDLESIRKGKKDPKEMKRQLKQIGRKIRRQIGKDYVLYPLLSGPAFLSTMKANATANLMRNLWSYMIIFCGHFPDGALHFTEEEIEDETRARVVPPPGARRGELRGRSAAARHEREPRLPDRAPPLPRPARATATARSRCACASSARSTTSPTPPGRCTGSTARRCAPSGSCPCPTPGRATTHLPRRRAGSGVAARTPSVHPVAWRPASGRAARRPSASSRNGARTHGRAQPA